MVNIKTVFENSEFNYDRQFNVVNKLPFDDEYFIQPNELSFYKTFNIKLSYLYDNFLYLYSRCSIPNFKIPTTYNGYIGVIGGNIGIYQDTDLSRPFSDAGFENLDNAKNSAVYKKDNYYYFFINCLSAINVLRYSDDGIFCQACPNIITTINPISGELRFQKINDISIVENYLYVSDEILNSVFKYDLETYFLDENIFKDASMPFTNQLFLLDVVGGEGPRYNSIKFKNPQKIATSDNFICVEDFGNKILKLYDLDLNFISYTTLLSLYATVTSFENIKFKDDKTIYGITKNGYYVFDINEENYQITLSRFNSLSSILYNDETILDIEFCKYEKDIIYILTDKSFIKKWEYANEIIGRKNASDFGENSRFKWMETSVKNVSSDNIYIYSYSSLAGSNQILIYSDSLDLISTFANDDFKVYSREEIKIKKNEWNQAWIYEKNIKKLAKNMDILKDNIRYNLILKKGNFGAITDLLKIYNEFIFDIEPENYYLDFSIGVNENFQSSVVNREFDKIYNIQQKTLDFITLDDNLNYDDYVTDAIKDRIRLITIVDGIQIVEINGNQIYLIGDKGIITLDDQQIYSFDDEELFPFGYDQQGLLVFDSEDQIVRFVHYDPIFPLP
jgi:hypothetical protein